MKVSLLSIPPPCPHRGGDEQAIGRASRAARLKLPMVRHVGVARKKL